MRVCVAWELCASYDSDRAKPSLSAYAGIFPSGFTSLKEGVRCSPLAMRVKTSSTGSSLATQNQYTARAGWEPRSANSLPMTALPAMLRQRRTGGGGQQRGVGICSYFSHGGMTSMGILRVRALCALETWY